MQFFEAGSMPDVASWKDCAYGEVFQLNGKSLPVLTLPTPVLSIGHWDGLDVIVHKDDDELVMSSFFDYDPLGWYQTKSRLTEKAWGPAEWQAYRHGLAIAHAPLSFFQREKYAIIHSQNDKLRLNGKVHLTALNGRLCLVVEV